MTQRTVNRAAHLCAVLASQPVGSCYRIEDDLGMTRRSVAGELAREAYYAAVDGTGIYVFDWNVRWAEAEAMLRTGWLP